MRTRQLLYVKRPSNTLTTDSFKLVQRDIPPPRVGQVLCRTILLSVDPANRAWMQARTYRGKLAEGTVMSGLGIAEVVESRCRDIPVKTLVTGDVGWSEYCLLEGNAVAPIEDRYPLEWHLSIMGITGLTAFFGLLSVGSPRPGETVLVSGAAGATGNVVGQLAAIHGCKAVGIVGDSEKANLLVGELGFDGAVSHRSPSLLSDIRAACPDGVDVYFDNVGGEPLAAALETMNVGGRIVCCGNVSQYDTATPAPGPRGVPGLLITKRLRMQGFIVRDYENRWAQARASLTSWIDAGRLQVVHEVSHGLEAAPAALIGQLAGANTGKVLVRIAPDP